MRKGAQCDYLGVYMSTLSKEKGKELREYIGDYTVFDLETTGISTRKDKIIEISALKVRDHKPVDEFSRLVNPEKPIPYQASRVNHITDEMVAQQPVIDEVMGEFLAFVGDDVLIGQNIKQFDMEFIYRECKRIYDGLIPGNDVIDTCLISRVLLPCMKHNLAALCAHYHIPVVNAHRALADSRMTMQVYECLGKEL